jgi:hypothetical protein
MKRLILLYSLFGSVVSVSCNNKAMSFKGEYAVKPAKIVVSSKEKAWTKIIETCLANGWTVKTLDKSNGLITTETSSFLNSYTWEHKDGSITDPKAFVVCAKLRGLFTINKSIKPTVLQGQWSFYIRDEEGRTVVETALTNATGKIENNPGKYDRSVESYNYNIEVRSTGVFEKIIEEAMK